MDVTNLWSDFFRSWKFVAGERFSAHAKPVDVKNGIVIVEADHPGWIQLMQFEQNQMLKKFQNNFPELKLRGIAFKVRNETQGTMPESREIAVDESIPDDAGEAKPDLSIAELLETVQDPGFRSLLGSVASTLEEENRKRTKKK